MRRFTPWARGAVAAALTVILATAAQAQTTLPEGDWDGSLSAAGASLRITLHVGVRATFDSPDQGAFCLPLRLGVQDGKITADSPAGIHMAGMVSPDGAHYDATLTQGGASLPVSFVRRTGDAPAPGLAAGEREVRIGEACRPQFGTYRPAATKGPAVLLLAGSGPTDRNGDQPGLTERSGALRLIAEALAKNGIASLRTDKPGVGMSRSAAPAEVDLRFTTYVDSAAAWAQWLSGQPNVSCVVLLGHSEGALVALLAAQKFPVCGVISVSGAGRPTGELLRLQARANGLTADQLTAFDAIVSKLEHGELVPTASPDDALFRPDIQPFLISEFSIDPVAALKAIKAKVLIIHGDNDLLVTPDNARLLAAGRPDAKLVIVPGMVHPLKLGAKTPAGQAAARADPNLPLAPGLADAIVSFVKSLP